MTGRAAGTDRAWVDANGDFKWLKATLVTLLALFLIVAVSVAGCAGCKSFQRAQKRADATNQTKIVHQQIKTAGQQAQVNRAQIEATKAEAEKRFQESIGIRRAQDEISKTLSPLYIQHEAIQAQEQTARTGRNNTIIYVPSGNSGVPLVQTPPLRQHLEP